MEEVEEVEEVEEIVHNILPIYTESKHEMRIIRRVYIICLFFGLISIEKKMARKMLDGKWEGEAEKYRQI